MTAVVDASRCYFGKVFFFSMKISAQRLSHLSIAFPLSREFLKKHKKYIYFYIHIDTFLQLQKAAERKYFSFLAVINYLIITKNNF